MYNKKLNIVFMFEKYSKDEIEDDEELKRKKKSSLTVLQRNESLHNDEKD